MIHWTVIEKTKIDSSSSLNDLKDKSQASAEANLVARFRKVGVTQAEVNRLWKSFKDVASVLSLKFCK